MIKRKKISPALIRKLKNIKLLALDVDGVLTDCRTYLDNNGEWRRTFSIRDGYGMKMLKDCGIELAVITGTKARDIQERVRQLSIRHFYEGHLDKLNSFDDLLKKTGFKAEQIAYMGDDIFDLPVLKAAGFSATVSDAMEDCFECSDYTAQRPAGNGAVREVCDLILKYSKFTKEVEGT